MILNNEIWRKLESELIKGEKISAKLAIPEKSKKLYAGIDANKKRHLLVPLEEIEDGYTDSQSRGLSIATRDLIVLGSNPKKYIDITCQDTTGYIIFDVIASEIAEKLDAGNPKEIIINVVSKWRRFWGQTPKEILSYEELIGLFSELWFLYNWLFQKMRIADAINSWRGPFLSRHDFEMRGKSIEVKATTNTKSRSHRINGIDQLLPPKEGELMLFSLRLREEQGSEETLPKLVALCQEKLKENIEALSKFENTLAATGYSPIHDEEYSKFKFRIVDEKLYTVKEGFPRIISSSFREGLFDGVSQIVYTINLDGFDNFCIANAPDNINI